MAKAERRSSRKFAYPSFFAVRTTVASLVDVSRPSSTVDVTATNAGLEDMREATRVSLGVNEAASIRS